MQINVTIPVFNAERVLENNVERVLASLEHWYPMMFELVIVNNGSTDRTLSVARTLAESHKSVYVIHLAEKGRGRAIKTAWLQSKAEIVSYMDVDLSSDLGSLPGLIEPLMAQKLDLVIGSRLLNPKTTTRSFRREVISRCYNRIVKALFQTRVSDPQCGFKAARRSVIQCLLPYVQDEAWFFDTELLILAEENGFRIHNIAVPWTEHSESTVKVIPTAIENLRGLVRLKAFDARPVIPKKVQ